MSEPRRSTDEETAPLLDTGDSSIPGLSQSLRDVFHEPLNTLSKALIVICLLLLFISSLFIGLFAGAEHRIRSGDDVITTTASTTVTLTTTASTQIPTHSDPPKKAPCLTPECVTLSASILTTIDTRIDPCDDFYAFTNHGWLEDHPLPEGKASYGIFNHLSEENFRLLEALITRRTNVPNQTAADTSTLKKLVDFHNSCLDESTLADVGQQPLIIFIEQLRHAYQGPNVKSRIRRQGVLSEEDTQETDVTAAVAWLHSRGIPVLFDISVDGDVGDDPDRMTLQFSQSGLGLPSKEYYEDDVVVGAYEEAVAATLEALDPSTEVGSSESGQMPFKLWPPISWPPWGPGHPPEEDHKARAQRLAKQVTQFETKLARISLDLDVLYQDPHFTYNRLSFANFSDSIPEIDFAAYLSAFAPRAFPDRIIVSYPPYVRDLSHLLADTKSETILAYLTSRSALSLAENLGSETAVWKAHRSLQEVLRGLKKGAVEARSDFCLRRLESTLGFATGRFFVNEAFGGDSQISATKVISDIIDTFKESLPNLSWMDSSSAAAAAEKASNMRVKVGYPLSPNTTSDVAIARYYQSLRPDPSKFFENDIASRILNEVRTWALLGRTRDKESWEMYPTTVNAYFNPPANEIVFPAGILRPPFFSRSWPAYVNYGAFGAVAAHELTHAFDSAGRMYNQNGKLEEWWTNSTSRQFDERQDCIVRQYSDYSIDDGHGNMIHVNGNLTSGENIGDAGLIYAYRAWKREYKSDLVDFDLPGLSKFSKEQLFFISYARVWARNMKTAAAVQQVRTDPHSPARFRVQGTLSNIPEFATAFNCSSGSRMNPVRRCSLWE